MKPIYILITLLFINRIFAGEELTGYGSNPALSPALNKAYQLHYKPHRIAALSLPFFDDFYQSSAYPDPAKWQDNFVYVNQTFAIDPVSIGVATFDGLNPVGKAYNLVPTASGAADKLTSQPIDLSGLTKDSSVYLSFFYQSGGWGETPELNQDYLSVEFFTPDSTWRKMWQTTQDSIRPFTQVFIQVDTPFFYNGFQFRFNTVGNLAGMNDVWNVDYVVLDKNRDTAVDRHLKEMAYQYPGPNLLKRYYSIPYKQFDTTDLRDTVSVFVRNNFINPTTDIVDHYEATLLNDGSTIADYDGPSRDLGPETTNEIKYPKFIIPAATYPYDTVTVQVKYFYDVSAEAGLSAEVLANNTVYHNQVFSNYMAYDDGSPERGYWVTNVEGYKLAVGYNLRTPDTLRAVKMQFTPVQSDIESALFSVMVWKNLQVGTGNADVVYEDDFLTMDELVQEYGYDTINGYMYYTYKADKVKNGNSFPLFMTDSFYVGLLVSNKNSLTVGYDRNNDGSFYNYYFNGVNWFRSGFPGSMIINPVLGAVLPGNLTPVRQLKNDYFIKLYPNPATNHIYLSGVKENSLVEIMSLYGNTVKSFELNNDRLINLDELPASVYVLRITGQRTKASASVKFIKIE